MSEYCVFKGWGKCPKKAKKQTNADRIRAQISTDEGLADFINQLDPDADNFRYCNNNDKCTDLIDKGEGPTGELCRQCLMDYLQADAEEENVE